MSRTRVRDMPRSQQRAVFAKLAETGYLDRVESAEKYHRRRDFLIKKHDLAETTEDKIWRIQNDPKLSHREKQIQIRKIKEEAAKKLSGLKARETSQTVTGQMKKDQWRKFKKRAYLVSITDVPKGHTRGAFDSALEKRKFPATNLYAHEGLLLTQEEYREGLRNRRQLPSGAVVIPQASGGARDAFNAVISSRQKDLDKTYITVDGVVLKSSVYKKAHIRNARVRYPAAYRKYKKGHNPDGTISFKKGTKAYKEKSELAEKLKKHKDKVKEPHALATYIVKKRRAPRRQADVVKLQRLEKELRSLDKQFVQAKTTERTKLLGRQRDTKVRELQAAYEEARHGEKKKRGIKYSKLWTYEQIDGDKTRIWKQVIPEKKLRKMSDKELTAEYKRLSDKEYPMRVDVYGKKYPTYKERLSPKEIEYGKLTKSLTDIQNEQERRAK